MAEFYQSIFGIRTRYIVAGQGEPLVLLHGLGGSVASWRANIEPLSERFRVFAVDLPGHGASGKPDIPYNLDMAVGFLGAFLDHHHLDSAWLVGNSTGGLIAAEFACRFPDRAQGLVLVDSVGFGRQVAGFIRLMSVPPLGEVLAFPSKFSIRALLRRVLYDDRVAPPDLVEELLGYHRSPGFNRAMMRALRAGVDVGGLLPGLVLTEKARALDLPTLICWGENDRIVPVAQAYAAREAIRGSALRIFPSCGHWPQMEKAEEFNRLAASFIEDASRQGRPVRGMTGTGA